MATLYFGCLPFQVTTGMSLRGAVQLEDGSYVYVHCMGVGKVWRWFLWPLFFNSDPGTDFSLKWTCHHIFIFMSNAACQVMCQCTTHQDHRTPSANAFTWFSLQNTIFVEASFKNHFLLPGSEMVAQRWPSHVNPGCCLQLSDTVNPCCSLSPCYKTRMCSLITGGDLNLDIVTDLIKGRTVIRGSTFKIINPALADWHRPLDSTVYTNCNRLPECSEKKNSNVRVEQEPWAAHGLDRGPGSSWGFPVGWCLAVPPCHAQEPLKSLWAR